MSTTSNGGGGSGDNGGGYNNGGFFSDDKAGGFAYGVGVSAGILLLITTITLASYFCTRDSNVQESDDDSQRRRRDRGLGHQHHGGECVIEVVAGIDEATLKTYPKLAYSQLLLKKKGSSTTSSGSCCSICLADYKGNDVVRLLPDCGHVFHLKCVDPWLRVHPTCPVCRTSPLPTPQSTPLAETTPAVGAGAGAGGLGGLIRAEVI